MLINLQHRNRLVSAPPSSEAKDLWVYGLLLVSQHVDFLVAYESGRAVPKSSTWLLRRLRWSSNVEDEF